MKDKKYVFILSTVSKTILLGAVLASVCVKGCVIYLYGNIGVGKSIFCASFIRALGYVGHVCSPTYTVVESYLINNFWCVHHFDFYRLSSIEDIENIGARDYFNEDSVCLVEWPKEDIMGGLPAADILVFIDYNDIFFDSRKVVIKFISVLSKKMLLAVFPYWKLFE